MYRRRVFIVGAKRTAIGNFLGTLYESDPADVCSQLVRGGFPSEVVSDVQLTIVGNVIGAGTGQGVARKIAILSGVPTESPAYAVNMVCGSGMQAVRNAIREIECGLDLVLAGGFEFMSNIPFATDTYMRLGKKFGDFRMVDLMTHDGLTDAFTGVHMGITAENVAKRLGVTRAEQDAFSYATLQRAIDAVDKGKFSTEIVPVTVRDYRGNEHAFSVDEFPNRRSTPEKVASLKPTFLKDGTGTVTAASSSGINDGAAFLMIASEEYCRKHAIEPVAEIVADAAMGLDPQVMGLGPFFATKKLFDEHEEYSFDDIDYIEMNEAFAAQAIGSVRLLAEEFGTDEKTIFDRTNVWGSGLGLGHPLGATGARIITTLTSILRDRDAEYGLATLCIGGGMGTAVLLRRSRDYGIA